MPPTKITVRNDGPLRVEGEVELVDMEGKPYGLGGRTAVALCRCGHSANKPFCDGSHKTAGFQDKQQARDLPPPSHLRPKPPFSQSDHDEESGDVPGNANLPIGAAKSANQEIGVPGFKANASKIINL